MLSSLDLSGTDYSNDWEHPEAASRTWKPQTGASSGASHDFENEFQFQLQGYASAGGAVNPDAHNRV
jgi:hypothetical protein